MARIAVTLILICLHITYCTAQSRLTPSDFDKLKGYPFCSYATAAKLKEMCLKLATTLGYRTYKETNFDNLQCEEYTVWLKDHPQNAPWESRTTYLLECIFEWNDANLEKAKKYLGDGISTDDVFLYTPNSQNNLVAERNYTDFIKNMFR